MKVFACRNQETYGGGLILVAANTKEEAFNTAAAALGGEYFVKLEIEK